MFCFIVWKYFVILIMITKENFYLNWAKQVKQAPLFIF